MRWARRVARMRKRNAYRILVIEKPEIFGDFDVDGRIISKCMLEK
jgi:hypothetical protein